MVCLYFFLNWWLKRAIKVWSEILLELICSNSVKQRLLLELQISVRVWLLSYFFLWVILKQYNIQTFRRIWNHCVCSIFQYIYPRKQTIAWLLLCTFTFRIDNQQRWGFVTQCYIIRLHQFTTNTRRIVSCHFS